MPQYRGKIRGTFEKTQDVNAKSLDEAKEMLQSNLGDDIECTAVDIPEILSIDEIGD